MRGCRGLPIRRRRPEFWPASAAQPSAILAIANLLAKASPKMRIRFGPGYRVYFVRTGTTIYVLLTGGDKSSQQGGQKSWQRGASSPLPLVGRGRGWGSATGPPLCRSLATPTPTLPHKGEGEEAPRATCHDFCPSYPSQKQDIARAQKMARELKDTKP